MCGLEWPERGPGLDTGEIVDQNSLRPTDYLVHLVAQFPNENLTRGAVMMIRPVTDGYEVIGLIDV